MNKINQKIDYLKLIVEEYIKIGLPISSKNISKKLGYITSPATIRNKMNDLEKKGFLTKAHISSGRIPTSKGYEYYSNIAESSNEKLISKIEDIFSKRRLNIDNALDQAASIIAKMTNMTLITSDIIGKELLKSIYLTPLESKLATIIIVTSSGKVFSKNFSFDSNIDINDLKIAIRLFNERLIDTFLIDLPDKIMSLKPLLSKFIKNYDKLIQALVTKVFNFNTQNKNNIYGKDNLIKRKEISREQIAKIIDLIENKSIWSTIENNLGKDETLKLEINNQNISILSKKIELVDRSKEISIVGSNLINYGEAKQILNYLEAFLKKNK